MKVVEESKNFAIVEYPPMEIVTRKDVVIHLEKMVDMGLEPLHRLEGKYQFNFVCRKTSKYKP